MKKTGVMLCWIVFGLALAVVAVVFYAGAAPRPVLFAAPVAALAAGYFCFRRRESRAAPEDPVIRIYDRMILYPAEEGASPAPKKREQYVRDLSYQGFIPVGLYRVYNQGFAGMQKLDYLIEGFANHIEKAYAAAHYPGESEPWLEIVAPFASGGSFTATDADRDVSVFAQRRPGHRAASAPGGGPAVLMGLLKEGRAAEQAEPGEVDVAAFAAFFMREDALHRDWCLDGMRDMRDTDLVLREHVLAAGVAGIDSVDRLLFAHDRLAMWQVNFILMLHNLWAMTPAEKYSDTWKYMTPRHVFAYVAENRRRAGARLEAVATLDSPVPSDVYRIAE